MRENITKVVDINKKTKEKLRALYRKNLAGVILQDTLEKEVKQKPKEGNDGQRIRDSRIYNPKHTR